MFKAPLTKTKQKKQKITLHTTSPNNYKQNKQQKEIKQQLTK